MTVLEFMALKRKQQKISMVTCYDTWSAKLISGTPIDGILVGDSLAMVMHGHPTTLPASMAMMELHTKAVARGLKGPLLVADMPFLSFRQGIKTATQYAGRLMQAGAGAVKIEGAKGNLEIIRHLVESGIPVMGHLGLTPQSIHQLGGFKVQGQRPKEYQAILEDAHHLQTAGCFSIVLECVPQSLAEEITKELEIPVIGIGAGPHTDGQILVLQDMLGMNQDFKPKFLRHFLDGASLMKEALTDYANEVRAGSFPNLKESYDVAQNPKGVHDADHS